MLLVASGMSFAFALLPALLSEAGLAQREVWRACSAALLVWQTAIAVHRNLQFRRTETGPPFSRLVYVWVGGIVLLQALNLALAASWPYLFGVFGLLVNGFVFFLALLLSEDAEPERRDASART